MFHRAFLPDASIGSYVLKAMIGSRDKDLLEPPEWSLLVYGKVGVLYGA